MNYVSYKQGAVNMKREKTTLCLFEYKKEFNELLHYSSMKQSVL